LPKNRNRAAHVAKDLLAGTQIQKVNKRHQITTRHFSKMSKKRRYQKIYKNRNSPAKKKRRNKIRPPSPDRASLRLFSTKVIRIQQKLGAKLK